MPSRARRLLRSACLRLLTIMAVVLLAGLACASMVRFAPGFEVDERELDPHLSAESIAAIRAQHDNQRSVAHFYFSYMAGLLHGDLGEARTFSQPISRLLKDRAPTTAQNLGYGLALAWSVALAATLIGAAWQKPVADALLSTATIALLSLPAAVVALLIVIARKPASVAIAAALLPVLYRYSRNVVQKNYESSWIMAARARGVGKARILFMHVLAGAAPELIALAGVSLNMAFGAALPVEVIADSAGVGQLAWEAALARDLPLLVTITGLLAAMTLFANAAAGLVNEAMQPEHA
jgi:peptide/nickel transport system permease protein